jgi:hypothetical protein
MQYHFFKESFRHKGAHIGNDGGVQKITERWCANVLSDLGKSKKAWVALSDISRKNPWSAFEQQNVRPAFPEIVSCFS